MDITGLIQSYDRGSTSTPQSRGLIAPQHHPQMQYSTAASDHLVASQPVQQSQFSYNPYTSANINILVPAPQFLNNFIRQRAPTQLVQTVSNESHGATYSRGSQHGFVAEIQSQSPHIKAESPQSPPFQSPTSTTSRSNTVPFASKSKAITHRVSTSGSTDNNFRTEVDTLMKAIQAKSTVTQTQQVPPPNDPNRPVVGVSRPSPYAKSIPQEVSYQESNFKLTHEDFQNDFQNDFQDDDKMDENKRYRCLIDLCEKKFTQRTHLEIHMRAHTGFKPYACKQPGCDRTFSQMGNLRTHERRHTGEKPFRCDICDKRFGQRGNVRAHKTVHNQLKPYLCRLDSCGKQFTQLGNLKSHQNKFHGPTIRDLTSKFASIKDGDLVNSADKELWEYFADLYKNSNKGIKGRGKDRKVGPNHLNAPMKQLAMSGHGGYGMSSAGQGHLVHGMMGSYPNVKSEPQYEMFGGGSQSGSCSSATKCYGDAPSDGFGDISRGNLAFGDRLY